ncbi:FAD-dependent thymidylate synthase [bacterium]|jgi:thymidylate synthase (FAD)|nr:FAD-dependent thymidylate synthase [bacterium]
MIVSLMHATPPDVVVKAIRMCHDSFDNMDSDLYSLGEKDKDLIRKVILNKGHESVSEHCSFTWEINDISEYAHVHLIRHRIGVSYSVQSTRYTFIKSFLKNDEEIENFIVNTPSEELNKMAVEYLSKIKEFYQRNSDINKDIINQFIPRVYKLNLMATFNIRSLRHFIKLRNTRAAHYEIRKLAEKMLRTLSKTEYAIFFEDLMEENK